jgi:hypothetical protein
MPGRQQDFMADRTNEFAEEKCRMIKVKPKTAPVKRHLIGSSFDNMWIEVPCTLMALCAGAIAIFFLWNENNENW